MRDVESGYTLGIVGARTFTDYSRMERFIREVINEHGLPSQVVSGGARGADSLANTWAMSRGIPMITHLPNWNLYGKRAAFIRNSKIIDDADILIAFPSISGKGTQMTMKLAETSGIECIADGGWELND